jgi:hypothetical protein
MLFYPPPPYAHTSTHTPTMPHSNSRPATFSELETAARENYHVAPGRKLKLEECLRLVAMYREKADVSALLPPESDEGRTNDQARGSGVTGNTLENLERGYINYTRAQMLIEKIHRDPELEMALTEQQALDLSVVSPRNPFFAILLRGICALTNFQGAHHSQMPVEPVKRRTRRTVRALRE